MQSSTLGLYIHIPFCRVKCTYCHFNTYIGLEDLYQAYTEALVQEIQRMGTHRARPSVSTIFIGGGTPTVLGVTQLDQILQACQRWFNLDSDLEVTTEANPVTLNLDYLRDLLAVGVNRISFGAQSFNEAELIMLGRDHDAATIGQTVALARSAGVRNLSFDLMFGLPTQSLETWQITLSQAVRLGTEHLSLYGLTIDPGTALRASVAQGKWPSPDPDLAADMYELADQILQDEGYEQYEISNWAKRNFESRHNLNYLAKPIISRFRPRRSQL